LAAITNILPPSAPTITSTAFDTTSITLTFTAPAATGGGPITGYRTTCNGGALVWFAPATVAPITISGLQTNVTYVCTLSASNLVGYGAASNSVSVKPVAPTTPPDVYYTAPPSGVAAFGSTVDLAVNAVAGGGTLTLIELFDGPTLLSSIVPPAGLTAYVHHYSWSGMTLGDHSLTTRATNSQDITKTSSPWVFRILTPPAITLTTPGNLYFAGETIALTSIVTPAPGAEVFRLEIFASDGLTNTKIHSTIGGSFSAAYNFSWLNIVAGNYALTTVISDRQGLVITSAPANVTVVNNVSVQISAPLNGSTVIGDTVLVTGSAITPANSAVTVNGQLATLTANGQFFLNDLPLAAGANTVTATVTAPDGQTASQVITLNRSTTPPLFNVSVGPGGIVVPGTPFVVDVTVLYPNGTQSGTTPFGEIVVECASPGGSVFVALTLGTYDCSYTDPGTYNVKVTVKDSVNVAIYTATKRVTIKGATDNIATVRAVYEQLMGRLKAGDKATALNLFAGHAKALHDAIFTSLGTNLAAAAAQGGTVASVTATGSSAEVTVIRNVGASKQAFFIYLLLGEDGIWRIESM
jgi:hypothetical protein